MREDVIAAAVEEVTTVVLESLRRGDTPTPEALRLLLRGYAATGRDELRDVLEPALAHALELAVDSSSTAAPGWLLLFAEAADASEDARLRAAASDLASKARMNWGGTQPIDISAASVDAYLRALPMLADGSAQLAVDELERLVADAYEPGDGIAGGIDHEIHLSAALLTAFAVTERLPYAMLAEELLRHARPRLLTLHTALSFSTTCDAASALSRMAALHHAAEYRTAAVIAPGADYAGDAADMLERVARVAYSHGLAGAAYALAAGELQSAF
ncbi:MAG TPA: hypothetical protein VLV86_19190 [Vicinamibacterales bacterium]|nr:hypothetical protein [Vicinamibacterales bacterium]